MSKYTFEAYENNAGILALAVLDGDKCVYFHAGFGHDQLRCNPADELAGCIKALEAGDDTRDWDGNDEEPQKAYEQWMQHVCESREYGQNDGLIYDNEYVYPKYMAEAVREAFGIREDIGDVDYMTVAEYRQYLGNDDEAGDIRKTLDDKNNMQPSSLGQEAKEMRDASTELADDATGKSQLQERQVV